MKYFAEYLDNLDRVALSIEFEKSSEYQLRSALPETLELSETGKALHIIRLPANTETLHTTEYAASLKSMRLGLKVQSRLSLSEKTVIDTKHDPPRCSDGALLAPDVKWKQLPSEHWAELMDLWHCHKPSEPGHEDAGLYKLALNGFHPRQGLAYYSETYYLIHADDIARDSHALDCSVVKSLEPNEGNHSEIKIWKWELSKDGSIGPIFSRMLAELSDAHAAFTFTINSRVSIWVLKLDTMWTITNCSGPLKGMKVLYGSLEKSETRPDAEELTIPESALRTLIKELEAINARLPNALQVMNGWKLSFMPNSGL